jgi:hypothetical protein
VALNTIGSSFTSRSLLLCIQTQVQPAATTNYSDDSASTDTSTAPICETGVNSAADDSSTDSSSSSKQDEISPAVMTC